MCVCVCVLRFFTFFDAVAAFVVVFIVHDFSSLL